MASSYNRYTGSGAVGVYKDIVDDLFYVTQNETPIQDMAKNTESRDYLHFWESTVYAAVTDETYARADGASLTTTYTPPTKTEYSNYVVETAVPFDVTKRSAAIAKKRGYAGIRNMWATAKTEAMVTLKDAVEWSILNGQQTSGDGSNASKTTGLIKMATTYGSTSYEAAATFAFPTGGEQEFRDLLQTMRAAGGVRGRKKMVFTSYTRKDAIGNGWVGNATEINTMTKDAKIYADIKIYVSQYGPIIIQGHDMNADTELTVFDGEDLALAWLYRTQTIDLGRTGLQENIAAVANCLAFEYRRPTTLGHMKIS